MDMHSIYRVVGRYFRKRRLELFCAMFPKEALQTVIDLGGGGKYVFWNEIGYPRCATLINLDPEAGSGGHQMIHTDALENGLPKHSFDVAFSNSLIEHLGTWERQQAFATEMSRLSHQIWCQTPNRWFPVEPHYLGFFFHWLPRSWQSHWMIRYLSLRGWVLRPSVHDTSAMIAEVRLLSRSEMVRLFPACTIVTERFLGIPKSFIAIKRQPPSVCFAPMRLMPNESSSATR